MTLSGVGSGAGAEGGGSAALVSGAGKKPAVPLLAYKCSGKSSKRICSPSQSVQACSIMF